MYKLLLILKYLLKRRIAWVSLAAVMLCTTMVLVVISVMGGWLNMFKQSFHGLTGDIIVRSSSLTGFPYYEEMIDKIGQVEGVAAAVPSIETFGLLNVGPYPTSAVKVIGIPIDQIGNVNRFPDSLYRQHINIEEMLSDPKISPELRVMLEEQLKQPASFALLDRCGVPLKSMPADVKLASLPKDLASRFWFDPQTGKLMFKGIMGPDDRLLLRGLSEDPQFKQAVDQLFAISNSGNVIDYQSLVPRTRQDVTKWPGMIVGIGVIGIQRDKAGQWVSELGSRLPLQDDPGIYGRPLKLTVLGFHPGESSPDLHDKSERNYWLVDDSRTQIWQYDNNYVYVPFKQLQLDLGMQSTDATLDTGEKITIPDRTTEIHIRMKTGYTDDASLVVARGRIEEVVDKVGEEHESTNILGTGHPYVETWLESQAVWINAIENEKMLTVMLFGVISVVAIFLIFCIFYMIVLEKTRDIGIIKSVGASSAGVAGIFLWYGLTIGIIGSGLGLLLSYVIVHNINEMHAWLGRAFGVQIWNPEVYLFDKIPNQMSSTDIQWIVPIAILASVLGALIPAIAAGRQNPVESLRWE
jgi:lipoprotein-releasing system permease protein